MKTRQQSLHDEGGQSRAGEEGDAQKLDDVRVAYGAHQLALSHELGRGLGQLVRPSMQDGVDCFGGGFHGKGHLLHLAISPAANGSTSELDVGENERPQLGMVAEKIFRHQEKGVACITGCAYAVQISKACFFNPRRACARVSVVNPRRACARITWVCLSVCPSVPALAASASVETSKQRYSRVFLRLFLD